MFANPGGAVYGVIAVSALLAAESARRETYLKTVAAVLITLLLYWIAHAYAELAGRRLEGGGRLTLGALGESMLHEISLLGGAAIPLVPLLIWWTSGGSLTSAVLAAMWTSAGTIVIIELAAGLRARLTGTDLARQAVLGALLGLMVIALRVVLH
jgi:hypothetical protein